MRIDEIDLIGNFTTNGLSPQTDQFLGLSGSELFWLDPTPSQSGISIYGTRYVWCNSIAGDQVASGTALKNAYASASAFIVSATARGAVLVSPGVYDFLNSPLNITHSYIDLVGINSSADSVRLKASNANYVVNMIGGNIDMGLYNLSIGTASLFNVNGTASDYQRWGNVINYGNMFTDLDSDSIIGLNGDFRNIKVYDSPLAFSVTSGDINGVFDNIEIYSVNTRAFYNDDGYLFGTFSNITIHGTANQGFYGNTGLSGYFENIKGENSVDSTFYGATYLNATLKNIEFNNLVSFCNSTSTDLILDNIKINSISQDFVVVSTGNIVGTFSNIEIGSTNNLFFCSTSGNISGTYKDIVCNNTSAYGFSTLSGTISGTFENITLGDAGQSYFRTVAVGGISGTFKNIELGNSGGAAFRSAGQLNGTFSNIKTGYVNSSIFLSIGVISGTYEDIEIIGVTGNLFYSNGQINGTFKNITCGTVSGIFVRSVNSSIGSTFSNIEVGNILGNEFGIGAFGANLTLDLTATNITLGNVNSAFITSNGGLFGYFQKIYIRNVTNVTSINFLSSYNLGIVGTFKDIYVGATYGSPSFFYTTGEISGTFQNIEVYQPSSDGSNFLFFYGTSIDGIFDNITNNRFTTDTPSTNIAVGGIFTGFNGITGTFSNLYLGGASNAFNASGEEYSGPIKGTFKNINISLQRNNIGTFYGLIFGGNNDYPIFIEKSTIYGSIYNFPGGRIVDTAVYSNRLLGFDPDPPLNLPAINLTGSFSATIERCKFIGNTHPSSVSIGGSGNAQISYTLTDKGISGVTNLIGTPFNIDDASII